ncbi:alpha/beta fold hydrolase [Actinoplanes sp. DH11]|uniref:alpha/beta fold hydrolase n=1 Tax=Actinoplanes sp. DH11 TaxID=2857011 RepID=UPI001E371F7F|nr:alpha/beta hydrolase [Actinoplanes sp. DH11]
MIPVVIWGVLSGWCTPRGPLTATGAIVTIVVSVAAGVLAARTRRPYLVLPLLFVVAAELGRLPASGPSVDTPRLTAFGMIALVTVRGVHWLTALVPLLLGVVAARSFRARTWHRWPALALLAALLVAFAVPARTTPVPGGVAAMARVDGLTVMIRGARPDLPVLLFVPGTPGGSETGAVREHLAGLERHFIVATMDRRAFPGPSVSLDSEVADVLAVTAHLRSRFGRHRIHLLGFSGGSLVGAVAAARSPAQFHAYVGTGQAVDLRASDEIFYADILAWARATGRTEVADGLAAQGPPPYPGFREYELFLLHETEAYGQGTPPVGVGGPERTLLAKAHTLTAIMDTWDALYPKLQSVDLRRDVPRLAVPAWFVQGSEEMRGLEELFTPWYEQLQAPAKRLFVVPGAGHRAMFEQPDRFVAIMAEIAAAT